MAKRHPSHPICITVQEASRHYDQGNVAILEVVGSRTGAGY